MAAGRSPGSDKAHDIATVSSTHLFRLPSGSPSCAREHSGYWRESIAQDQQGFHVPILVLEGEGAKGRKGEMNIVCLSLKIKKAHKVSGFKYF